MSINAKSLFETCFRRLPVPVRYHLVGRWRNPRTHESISPSALRRIRDGLAARLGAGPGPSFLFLPTQTWYSKLFQRPQQMARALAEVGSPVVFIEPWEHHFAVTAQGMRARRFTGFRDLAPRLHLLRCPEEEVLADLLCDSRPDALVMLWPDQEVFFGGDPASAVVYEMIDDHSVATRALRDPEAWSRQHRHWLLNADVMVATAEDLLQDCLRDRPDTLLLNNAVRVEDWGVRSAPVPADLAAARRAKRVIGYYGALASWFDWDLWEAAARARPDWSFVAIGPPFDDEGREVIQKMRGLANTYHLESKPYGELPAYLAHFDVATIPFQLNPVTHACSPLKLFEYMAAGKPIVASPMREILKYRSVLFADGPGAFVDRLDEALARARDPEYLATLEREAKSNSWTSRASALRGAVERAASRRASAATPATL